MKDEFNLSDKILSLDVYETDLLNVEDVKEFIRRLKEESLKLLPKRDACGLGIIIDTLAGDKLK